MYEFKILVTIKTNQENVKELRTLMVKASTSVEAIKMAYQCVNVENAVIMLNE